MDSSTDHFKDRKIKFLNQFFSRYMAMHNDDHHKILISELTIIQLSLNDFKVVIGPFMSNTEKVEVFIMYSNSDFFQPFSIDFYIDTETMKYMLYDYNIISETDQPMKRKFQLIPDILRKVVEYDLNDRYAHTIYKNDEKICLYYDNIKITIGPGWNDLLISVYIAYNVNDEAVCIYDEKLSTSIVTELLKEHNIIKSPIQEEE